MELCLAEGGRGWLPQLVEVVVSETVPDHVRAALASLLPPLADQVRRYTLPGCVHSDRVFANNEDRQVLNLFGV